jgi:hypothetical protein
MTTDEKSRAPAPVSARSIVKTWFRLFHARDFDAKRDAALLARAEALAARGSGRAGVEALLHSAPGYAWMARSNVTAESVAARGVRPLNGTRAERDGRGPRASRRTDRTDRTSHPGHETKSN